MSQVHPNSSDSHHFRREFRDMVSVCKLRMIVIVVAFLQRLVRRYDLVKYNYGVVETTATALIRSHNRAASRSLQLKFLQEMPSEVFTGEWIVAKGDGSLEVALVDGATGDVVRHGAGSSGKIEIVPVEGNFDPGFEDFNTNIVVGEEGRTSLLGKNPYLEMKEGNAAVQRIKFKHTGKWMRKGKFRLGARFVHQPNGIRIREAVSEPFVVKDRRSKSIKCYPPSPTDEVWRLKNIGKGGPFHERLVEKKILTVKDFVVEFWKDRETLRDVLRNMPNANWKATLDHALTCHGCNPPPNDLAAPSSSSSTAFGNYSELQHENNDYCGLGSELLLSQTTSADATTLLLQSDTYGFSQLLSDDDIFAGCTCDQQNVPSNSEDCSEWVNTYNTQLDAIPKSSCKGWAKMCGLVRLFSLKKAVELKRLHHVAKKQRLWFIFASIHDDEEICSRQAGRQACVVTLYWWLWTLQLTLS